MSYVVLARKYRPRSFEEMVGQDHVVRALTHALEQQRLHHAYLFTGTRGIGKTTVSRILAKSLNCTGQDGTGGITAHPCGVCNACREIDADRYIDYVELDAASNRSIDEIRELIERAAYKPTVGRFKVFMIDEAHQLTKDAFNALLKTLEEPPEYLKFVLATTDPEKMLPTVLSRCLQFNLRPMAPQTVAEHLTHVLTAEQIPVDAGALRLLSRAARGSMRDALSLTDQAIAYGGGHIEESAVRAMLGTVDRRHAQRLIQSLAERDGQAVLAEVGDLRAQGLSAAGTLEEMSRLLQQMAVEQMVPGALDASDPDTEAARHLAGALASDETQLLYTMVLHGRAELILAPDEYAGLVMVLLRFLAFPPSPAPSGGGTDPGVGRRGGPTINPTHQSSVPSFAGGTVASASVRADGPQRISRAPAPVLNSGAHAVSVQKSTISQGSGAAASGVPVVSSLSADTTSANEDELTGKVGATRQSLPAESQIPRPGRISEPVAGEECLPAPSAECRTAVSVQAAAPPPRVLAPVAARDSEEPPPWMDEAPFIEEHEPVQALDEDAVATSDAKVDSDVSTPGRGIERRSAADVQRPVSSVPIKPAARTARTTLGDRWSEAVAGMLASGSIVALVRELALQSELIALKEASPESGAAQWTLRVEREPLRAAPLVEKLQRALETWLGGAEVRLLAVAGVAQDSPALREAERIAARQYDAETAIHGDSLVQSLLDVFPGARIVPGSIRPL